MNAWSEYLTQIELAAPAAPAPMLRLLMQELARALDELPPDCIEYGRMLLLKLDHLLTQQQVHAVIQQGAGSPVFLAPHLLIGDAAARRSAD